LNGAENVVTPNEGYTAVCLLSRPGLGYSDHVGGIGAEMFMIHPVRSQFIEESHASAPAFFILNVSL